MLCPYVALLTVVLCACSINGQTNDTIFFEFVPENIYEGQNNNCITLRRFGTDVGAVTINYTVSGIGITSPGDFTGGNFSIVYPPNEDPLKIPITFIDNSVCDASRTIVVIITGIDNVPVPESNLKHFIVVDDDGEWTAWDTTEGPCNCVTAMRDRFRNRTCDNKGIPGRTCDGPATINDTVSCAGDPACSTTTTPMPTTTTTTATTTPMPTTTTTTATTTPMPTTTTTTATTTPMPTTTTTTATTTPMPTTTTTTATTTSTPTTRTTTATTTPMPTTTTTTATTTATSTTTWSSWSAWSQPWAPLPQPPPWRPWPRPWRPWQQPRPWRPWPRPWRPWQRPSPWGPGPQPQPGTTEWSQWACGGAPCSATCGGIQTQTRKRTCTTGSVITETRTVNCSPPC